MKRIFISLQMAIVVEAQISGPIVIVTTTSSGGHGEERLLETAGEVVEEEEEGAGLPAKRSPNRP